MTDEQIKNERVMNRLRGKNWHIVFQVRKKDNEEKVTSEIKFELRGVWEQDLPLVIKRWLRREKIEGWQMGPSWNFEGEHLVFRTVTKVAYVIVTESLYQDQP